MTLSPHAVQAFQKHVPTGLSAEECWIWLGDKSGNPNYPKIVPYGRFYARGIGKIYAHRFAWMLANGVDEFPKGHIVCHSCDAPLCINPAHLFLGTHKENTADMLAKHRQAGQFKVGKDERRMHGDTHKMAKLTAVQVTEIRQLYTETAHLPTTAPERNSLVKLAKRYGVSKKTILNIMHNRIWLEQS